MEQFLRNPGPVLQQLQAKLEADASGAGKFEAQKERLEAVLAMKAQERVRVVGLFRRGRIDETVLDEQMAEIGSEEAVLQAQIEELRGKVTSAASVRKTVGSAEALLTNLRERLDCPVSWEVKRELIEVLVAGVLIETLEIDGVKQNKITVTYRFNEPAEPTQLVLPQAYSVGPVVRIPATPETIGDHLRTVRLKRKLRQQQVAQKLGVDKTSVHNWESNRTEPELRYMPAIIEFLGYSPLPEGVGWAKRLVQARTMRA